MNHNMLWSRENNKTICLSKVTKRKRDCLFKQSLNHLFNQTALVTLPERRQRVQAYTLLGVPLTTALTLLTLGFHVLFDRLCE